MGFDDDARKCFLERSTIDDSDRDPFTFGSLSENQRIIHRAVFLSNIEPCKIIFLISFENCDISDSLHDIR
jgi:hypothetical protein